MGMLDLNLGGVARPSFQPVPEDDYTLVLSDLKIKDGKKDATKQIAHCTYEIAEGEFAGRTLLYWQQLNPDEKDAGYLKVWAEALLGEPIDNDISLNEDDLIGKHCQAHIKQVPDNRDSTKLQNAIAYFILPFETE